MKIVVISDEHGRGIWKEIIDSETSSDLFIFLSDFLDPYGGNISSEQAVNNFKDIIDFKKRNLSKVILLIGNHDVHYLTFWPERYSRFNSKIYPIVSPIFQDAINSNLMQMCYSIGNNLFTHAGVTNTWLKNCGYKNGENVEIFINNLFKTKPLSFVFQGYDNYGDDVTQSPIWVRPNSLFHDKLLPYTHIIGHTQVKKIVTENVNQTRIILTDVLGTSPEYLIIENNNYIVKKIQ